MLKSESDNLNSAHNSFRLLDQYVLREHYRGWDIFDGLNSQLLKKITFLYRLKAFRILWIQFFKKSPVNFRTIAKIKKGYNAKGLALFSSGLILAGRLSAAYDLLEQLYEMTCKKYTGRSWGYNFDWQARAFFVPLGEPNMVTTVFCANAFLDYYEKTGLDAALRTSEDACTFILDHLILYEDHKKLCFGYIPGETARIHNANMLGAALLGRVYSFTGKAELYEKSVKAMKYSMESMKNNYSWPYGERYHHSFIDNFHSGFNIVSLKKWMDFTEDHRWEHMLDEVYAYYLNSFWLEDGCPKYYNNSLYPIDIHCSAQGIITCLTLEDYSPRSIGMAKKIADWVICNMQNEDGYFYYQKTKLYTNKIPYVRWAQAWMFYALSMLLNRFEKK